MPKVRDISPADRALWEARRALRDASALDAEEWASGCLGAAWRAAGLGDKEPERTLCIQVAAHAQMRPSPEAFAAVAALRRVAPVEARPDLDDALSALTGQPHPEWLHVPGSEPVRAWRAVDPWDSRRVLWVEFVAPETHTLGIWRTTSHGPHVTAIGVYPAADVPDTWAEHNVQPTPMTLTEEPVDDVLAEMADALFRTDISWPRPEEPEYAQWRMLAWSRCREYRRAASDFEPMPVEQRAELIDAFVTAGAPDDDVTRSIADLFIDYGDGYIGSGPLFWSPTEVELLLSDWLPRKAVLDADQRTALPDLLRSWVQFCLHRRGLDEEWIEPVVAAVDEFRPVFEGAFDDTSAWGPAKQIAAELAERGVDLTDPETVRQEVRALNAERLARGLLDEPDDADE